MEKYFILKVDYPNVRMVYDSLTNDSKILEVKSMTSDQYEELLEPYEKIK